MGRFAILAIVVAGCTETMPDDVPVDGPDDVPLVANAGVADLPGLRLRLHVNQTSDDGTTSGYVRLHYDEAAFRAAHGGACATLGGNAGGAIDGSLLEVLSRGATTSMGTCAVPWFAFTVRFDGTRATVVTVDDETGTVRAEYGEIERRVGTLRAPATWSLHPGDAVRLGWSHPEDIEGGSSMIYYYRPGVAEGDAMERIGFGTDEVQFTVPTWMPPSTGVIRVDLGQHEGVAAQCDGATACELQQAHAYVQSVAISSAAKP